MGVTEKISQRWGTHLQQLMPAKSKQIYDRSLSFTSEVASKVMVVVPGVDE